MAGTGDYGARTKEAGTSSCTSGPNFISSGLTVSLSWGAPGKLVALAAGVSTGFGVVVMFSAVGGELSGGSSAESMPA